MKGDAPLLVASIAAHGRDAPAVAHGRDDQLVEEGGVDHPVHSFGNRLAHPIGEIVAPGHDDVGAEVPDQLLVGRPGVGDDPEPLGLGQLDGIATDRAGRAGNGQRLTGLEVQGVQRHSGGQAVHGQGRGLGVGRSGRHPGDGFGGHHEQLGIGAVRAVRHHDRHHVVAGLQGAADAFTDLIQHPGGVHAGHVRRSNVLELGGPSPGAQPGVGRIDRGRVDPNPHLTRPGLRIWQLDRLQHIRTTERNHSHGFHGTDNRESGGGVPRS